MEDTRELQREKFCGAFQAFDLAIGEFDRIGEAFENEDVRTLFELAFSAYLEWKNYVEKEQSV